MLTGITVMAFIEKIVLLFKEVATSFILLFTAVSADGAATVPQIVALLFEQRKSATDLIEIFDVDVKAHD